MNYGIIQILGLLYSIVIQYNVMWLVCSFMLVWVCSSFESDKRILEFVRGKHRKNTYP